MNDALCSRFRDARVELRSPALDPALAAHVRSCEACSRDARMIGALISLDRLEAPQMLEAHVDAVFGGEFREVRATRALDMLQRAPVPVALDELVAATTDRVGEASQGAPDVLRRLVDEELADPAKATVRRFVGSMPRLSAPSALDVAVERELVEPASRRARPWMWVGSMAAAAAVVIAIAMRSADAPARRPTIEWIAVDDPAQLSPRAADLLAGFTGGFDLVRRPAEGR